MLSSPPNLITAIPCYVVRHRSTLINKLQRIHNIVARLITGHGRCEHITPVLKSLHWLPVKQRITFKTLVLVYKAVNNLAPVYLKELLYPYVPCRGLRSSENNLLVVPFTRSSVVQQCAFSAAGPRSPMEQSSTELQIGVMSFSF